MAKKYDDSRYKNDVMTIMCWEKAQPPIIKSYLPQLQKYQVIADLTGSNPATIFKRCRSIQKNHVKIHVTDFEAYRRRLIIMAENANAYLNKPKNDFSYEDDNGATS